MKKKLFNLILLSTLLIISSFSTLNTKAETDTIAVLTLKVSGSGYLPDYGFYIARYLDKLGIKVNIKNEEWIVFIGTITITYDFDLAFLGLTGGGTIYDQKELFCENGSLNYFGINTEIPYGDDNEEMLEKGSLIMNLEERQQHYYKWQQLIMDKLLPMLPFFSPRSYVANWATLDGYNALWGVVESLPYMEFTSLHEGQTSTEELNDYTDLWVNLNPFVQHDSSNSYIFSLVTESLIQLSPGFEPIKTGLIVDWQQDENNELLYKFTLRNDVYWNPSFNITGRDGSSDPLINENGNVVDPSILMKSDDGEFSNGTNQQVTAKDALFTLLAYANPVINGDADDYCWIQDIWIDPTDPLSFWIEIDGDPETEEKEKYTQFLEALTVRLLPEFFLNTTDETVTYSTGDVPMKGLYNGVFNTPQWSSYGKSAFGCGKYMLDYHEKDTVAVLRASPFWYGVGAIDGTKQDLDIKTINVRFIQDLNTILEEFKAGKLDLLGEMDTFIDERKDMQDDPKFEIQSKLKNYMNFMIFNLRRSFIGGNDNFVFLNETGYENYSKALAVRKAISYAIDREEINREIHDGEYLISQSPIYPIQSYWYYNDIKKYDHNIDTAIEWLKRAGFYKETTTTVPFIIISSVVAIFSYSLIKRRKK